MTSSAAPRRAAPTLISVETVQAMKPGSVLVDLAAGRGADYEGQRGGNCPLTEADKVVVKHGVTIVGYTNLASMVPADASSLYARNLLDFLKLIVTKEGALNIDLADDIVAATLLARDGEVARNGGLAYATRTGEQVSVVHATGVECVGERAHDVLLPDEFCELAGTPLACEYLIRHACSDVGASTDCAKSPAASQ